MMQPFPNPSSDTSKDTMVTLPQIPSPAAPDSPAHGWRGLLLDSARTRWSVEQIREILDLMARYRLNVLHWHLTDDAGWRFAVPGYPRLTEIAAQGPRQRFENYTDVDRDKLAEVNARAERMDLGGWYTDADIAAVKEHAVSLGIAVMPEVDLPGHMAAVIRAYPELGNPRMADQDPATWGRNDLLWPGPDTDEFIRAALTRVCELFEHPWIHIGGDECAYPLWEADGDLMRSVRARGIPHAQALQGEFMRSARGVLAEHGRSLAGWEELSATGLAGDELLFAWQEGLGVPLVQRTGNPWIYMDNGYFYLNRLAGPVATEPPGLDGHITAPQVLAAPVPHDDPQLRGVQAAVWCEFILDRHDLMYHLFPRLLAFAEVAWCGAATQDWDAFLPRLQAELAWLSDQGIPFRPLDPDLPDH